MAVQLSFRASNNEIECEALLASLRAAKHVGAAKAIVHYESQLVAQQWKGTYKVKNDQLQNYTETYKKSKEDFQDVAIKMIPREEN